MAYNWQLPEWPGFSYDLGPCEKDLFAFAERVGRVDGLLESLPEGTQTETIVELMVSEAIKTSEIEGEILSREDVMSSIRNHLGLAIPKQSVHGQRAEGAATLMIAVREHFAKPLTEETLFDWHTLLMQGDRRIRKGAWHRHEAPMQVVSGPVGREKIHFEAPPSSRVPKEMKAFVRWFNDTGPNGKKEIASPPVRSALAHLYFESIHPFEDGNGRIGRAISEKALSQGVGRPILMSLSAAIEKNKAAYYAALKAAQRTNEVTGWIAYFTQTCLQAQTQAEELVRFAFQKARFFDRFSAALNARQAEALRRMLEEGPDGFKGSMTAKKYMAITQASKATATRDLQELGALGVLVQEGGGRNTHYAINLDGPKAAG
ncbi:MAG: Fic family protein [Burkholderiales bacterium]|nr:Fic family protein [Burkholderiales bacterium]